MREGMISMETRPKLSIVVLTFYHEKYIRQALESVFMQKVDFDYEVLVGDDASGDGTQEIIREFSEKYPDVIKPVLRQENLGASRNAYDLYRMAKGEYIAVLEGDDYWLCPEKLQTQVNFLDEHPEFICCMHKCVVVDEDGVPDYTVFPHWTRAKRMFTLTDFLSREETAGQSGTQVFRNFFYGSQQDFSAIYSVHPQVSDKTLALILLSQGDIYCLNKIMSAYRFVIKRDGKNWFSIHHSNPNWQYDAFMRPVRLSEYAQTLGIKAIIGPKRDYHYTSLISDILSAPTPERLKNLAEMTYRSGRPLHCLGLIGKYLILK